MAKASKPAGETGDIETTDAGSFEEMRHVTVEQVLIVSAPGGPRRRAGLAFDKTPVELRFADLGEDPEETLAALRADPKLKIDGRMEEIFEGDASPSE